MTKLMDKRAVKYFLAFFIPFIVLGVMTIRPIATNIFGEEITIKGSAYSTRDLFRGDFMQLDYEISEVTIERLDKDILTTIEKGISQSSIIGEQTSKDANNSSEEDALKYKNEEEYFEELRGKNLYAVLKKEGKYYVVDKVTMALPKEGIYLKGRYEYTIREEYKVMQIKGIRIGYSLDKYFVSSKEKNENKNFEKQMVDANLKVYKGYSVLKEIR